jgi:hypothetical protein
MTTKMDELIVVFCLSCFSFLALFESARKIVLVDTERLFAVE